MDNNSTDRFFHARELSQQQSDFDFVAFFGLRIHRFASDATGFRRVGFGFEGESEVVEMPSVNVHELSAKQLGALSFH